MTDLDSQRALHQMAYLYLALAHSSDDTLTSVELQVITDRLCARRPDLDAAAVQTVVAEALEAYLEADDPRAPAMDAVIALRAHLTPAQRRAILDDLLQIAKADGLVFEDERVLLLRLASLWGLAIPRDQLPQPPLLGAAAGTWDVLHDLAYVYLVLAYGTDHTLTDSEVRVMLAKLRAWQPELGEAEARAILSIAMDHYAQGTSEARILAAVEAVRDGLPARQRQAALDDLVEIANADGIFLDDEEDLINYLTEAWSVSAFSDRGRSAQQ